MERTSFRVADNSPPQGGGDRGQGGGYRRGYRGGRSCGRTEPFRCYNCDEVGHITRDCPLPRRPRCNHCQTTGNAIEDCTDFIERLEAWARQINTNMVNSKPRLNNEKLGPTINAVTRGGTRTGADISNLDPHSI